MLHPSSMKNQGMVSGNDALTLTLAGDQAFACRLRRAGYLPSCQTPLFTRGVTEPVTRRLSPSFRFPSLLTPCQSEA